MGSPQQKRTVFGVVVAVVVFWHFNGETFAKIAFVLAVQGNTVVFRVTHYKNLAAVFCHGKEKACFVGFCKDSKVFAGVYIFNRNFCMSGMRCQKYIIEPSDQRNFAVHYLVPESYEAGLFLAMAEDGRKIFVMGHPEYDRVTLDGEYKRDLSKGLPIEMPKNYYRDNNPDNGPQLLWRAHANNLYTNWLNYYVYQATPYNLYGTPDFNGK